MKKRAKSQRQPRSSHPQPALPPYAFHLDCRSDSREIRRIESFLNKVNKVAKLDDGTFYRLLVATTEAVNNAIIHGNKSDPHKYVHAVCNLEKDSLVLRVKDEGKGFRPDQIPDPLAEKNLLKTSGRGIFLMRSLMDRVMFRMTPEGTEVELVVDLRLLK